MDIIVIPAREGSKGIPKKNKKILGPKPLIEWTIDFAIKVFKNYPIVISTDDPDIIDIGKKYGLIIRLRPKNLCQDNSMMIDVLKDALNFYENVNNQEVVNVILLQPTFPFREYTEVLDLKQIIKNHVYDNIVSVVLVEDNHPSRMYRLNGNNLNSLNQKESDLNRQTLEKLYLRNGAYYVFKKEILQGNSLYGKKIFPLVMTNENKINIDRPMDFLLAELLYEKFYKS